MVHLNIKTLGFFIEKKLFGGGIKIFPARRIDLAKAFAEFQKTILFSQVDPHQLAEKILLSRQMIITYE